MMLDGRARFGWTAAEALAARTAGLIPAVLIGVAACGVAIALADLSLKRLVAVSAVFLIVIAGVASRRGKQLLLLSWVACLTYNRSYFVEALGAHGSYGLYWIPSDVFLVALYGVWIYELVIERRPLQPVGRRLWPWFLPFAAACFLSIPGADRMDWGMFEMARVLRLGLILLYVRFNVRGSEWWTCVAGLGAAVLLQVTMGFLYVMTGEQFGLAFFFGTEGGERDALKAVMEGASALEFRRAEGALGHANTLAVYLLLTAPAFLALAWSPLRRSLRAAAMALGLIGVLGIALTMSRTSWVLIAGQLLLLLAALTVTRVVRVRQALGLLIVAAAAVALLAAPFADRIHRRFTGNFSESLDFRAKHDRIALDIWQQKPVLGIGLNQYSEALREYGEPEVEVLLTLGEYWRRSLDVRITAWVHNIYLLLLAETGVVGLTAFLLFVTGGLLMGLRAIRTATGALRLASLGLTVGMVGLHGHGLQEAALWIDPITCSFALVMALLNNVPRLEGATA